MNSQPSSPSPTRAFRAEDIRSALKYFRDKLRDPSDLAMVKTWTSQLAEVEKAHATTPESSIAFLGESGAGKSSLINSILGMDLLPHDAGRAVTASVAELACRGDRFVITAEVTPREDFLQTFNHARSRLCDAKEAVEGEPGAFAPAFDESDVSLVRAVTGKDVEEIVRLGTLVLADRVLLSEVKQALNDGPTLTWQFEADQLDEMKEQCQECLSARRHLWPLIRRLTIEGPFPQLTHGIRLVDIPGLNDPDPARSKVARDYLQGAKLVWLVLNSKRAMTGTITNYLTESRLLSKLELEGRLGSLVVVATHADQMDEQALIKEFDLPEDVELEILAAHQRRRVERDVRSGLLDAWDHGLRLAEGGFDEKTATDGRRRLESLPLFSVSSTNYQLLRKMIKSRSQPFFQTEEQTGIPELLKWLATDFVERERQAHQNRYRTKLDKLAASIRNTFGVREDIKRRLANLTNTEKGGLQGIQDRARTFLDNQLAKYAQAADAEVQVQASKMKIAISAAVTAADRELRTLIPDRLAQIHWSTLRAIMRHNGVFHGSTRRWDIPDEITRVICAKIVFRWSELFGDSTRAFLENTALRASDLLDDHATQLASMLAHAIGEAVPSLTRQRNPTQSIEYDLDQKCDDIAEELKKTQLSFERDLQINLRAGLKPAFESAASESGPGMKVRIVERVSSHLAQIIPSLLPILATSLNNKVGEVSHLLLSLVDRTHETVRAKAKLEASNLEQDLSKTSSEQLLAEAQTLAEGLRHLNGSR